MSTVTSTEQRLGAWSGRDPRRPTRAAAVLVTVGVAAAGLALWLGSRPAGDPMLPDLGVAPPDDLTIGVTPDGTTRLLLSAMIVNVGEGPLLVDGSFDIPSETWAVDQTITRSARGADTRRVRADVAYGGDGHDHLHVLKAAVYSLVDAETGQIVAGDEKVGFCFYDRDPYRLGLANAAPEPVHDVVGCGTEVSTRIVMGLSVGWGDNYLWNLPGQSIVITDVPDGEYLLDLRTDPDGLFVEADEDNNTSWARVRLEGIGGVQPSVTVLETGSDV